MGHSLTITHRFAAPPELVWAAWTDPERLVQWWGPEGCTGTTAELDVRPGGAWSAGMRNEEGEYPAHGTYSVVEPPTRLVMTFVWDSPGTEETTIDITLKNVDGGTEMTFVHSGFGSQGSADGHREGWKLTFPKLAVALEP